MYVISLVKLRKNLGLFLKILAVLIIVGLLLPRVLSMLSGWASPSMGWLKSSLLAVIRWFSDVFAAIGERLEPYVETLKDYYRGR